MNMDETRNGTKKNRLKKTIGYVVGSIILFSAACAIIPKAMTTLTGILYKATAPKVDDDDDWGPVIEKKEGADE